MKTKPMQKVLSFALALVMVLAMVPFGYLPVSAAADPNKIDVWDFGAEQLDTSIYNNRLTVDEINSWYPGVPAGTKGKNLASFTTSDGQLSFNDGGNSATHRLRTDNTALTRYDERSLTVDGEVYHGFIYSNTGSTKNVYISVEATAGDIISVVAAGNNGDSTIAFADPDGVVEAQAVAARAGQKLTFYPKKTGTYKVYSVNEKLMVARITREHTNVVSVSGSVTAPAELNNYSLVFTNTANGVETVAPVENGKYTANLNASYTYDVALQNANGYVIESEKTLTLDKTATAATFDVTVKAVDLVTVTGNILGLDADALSKLHLTLETTSVYQPEIVITGTTYTVDVEVGAQYTVKVEGVNDYALTSGDIVSYIVDTTADITFEPKPTYAVTIVPEGMDIAELANATFTFTNLKEEGYVYTFTGTEGIALRDGVYSVVVTNIGAYVQKLTSNLKVEGAPVSKTIAFTSDITVWDFSAPDFKGKFTTGGAGNYNGLVFTNAANNKDTYLLANGGTVSVPVKGSCQIQVSACYQYSFYFTSETEPSVNVHTGQTGKIDTFTYTYTGEAGMVDIHILGQSYLTKIELVPFVAYKDTVTVGASGCDYTTINAALDAVRAMSRPNNERVTISIQPGNYEEMLVLDVPNVTLKNASATPSIELTDSGVNIDPNAVRITHYYGHGYTYFSMGSDCKYDPEILKVNKENGYTTFDNPGSGTTNGSYWNATVVITASGIEAEGIIFENSFNQYVSAKAADDVIVAQAGKAKEPASAPRASLPLGSTAVQDKPYVERAAALAIANNCTEISFDNCKFIGRQDTLYGGTGVTAAFYDCSVYGAVDYIFGGMTAVFAKCDLVFNTSDDKNDFGYITAAQQQSGRGYLMYNCTVTSTIPGVDTASTYASKPGYLGRPWQANTSEVVFYKTVINAAASNWNMPSLIQPAGWSASLGGESAISGEYGSYEMAGVDNTASRVAWANKFEGEKLADGKPIAVETFLGAWDAFAGKDMTIAIPGETHETHEDANEDGRCDQCLEIIDGIAAGFSRSLTLEGDIGVNFYMDLSDATIADTGAKMRFTVNGVDTDIMVSDAEIVEGHYRFTCRVAAKQMADEITAKIIRGDGTEGKVFTYSVKTYFQNKLKETDVTQEMKDLAAAMLNYGAAAQTHFGYNTTALANDGMGFTDVTMLDASVVQDYKKSLTQQGENAGITDLEATVVLESKTMIRVRFQLSDGNQISDYTFTASDGTKTWEVKCVAAEGNKYILEIPNIAAQDLENMYTISVSKAGAPVLEIRYGVFSYVYSKLTDTAAGDPLKLLVSALHAYNTAADAFFTA